MTLAIDDVQLAYCRAARRLRSVHADRPARKLRALAAMSQEYDAARRSELASSPIAAVVRRVTPEEIFAAQLDAELAGDVLTYSHRQALLAEADRLGLGRFAANLLIAEAQHRAGPAPIVRPAREDGRGIPLPVLLALVLGLELLAALAVYGVFLR